mmetsp:Transcript_7818/g.17038  ORF Transcript_7818/g.17038 Transcript_7818/m.17038 type:complete len:219 (-) Transcript_7818:107-763(-)|eukprot:CAMPEP_0178529634 /NCGR_PEP_ID=MMETSP0696-20121128/32434_1 /TAXON_ID=265572 /ORGANISM="Extubocellulus spinifer, Strain CCMP396" /LENGTH=218 /DNA_ID=CAMNT_0020161355 /DNA_START=139 /DNA_END=795 /DNA_ORIENTATION=+
MKKTATTAACALAATTAAAPACGFSFVPAPTSATGGVIGQPSSTISRPTTSLQMGLFDGVKEAFSAPALEKSQIDAERETPIDRWMGWSVKTEDEQQAAAVDAANFVDSMNEANYVTVSLSKPMGIVFEENDEKYGGIFVLSLSDGSAQQEGTIRPGDELVAVGNKKVAGLAFDDALGAIIDSDGETTKLVLFRGSAKDLYGPTGASQEWLDEFVAKA